MNRMVKCPYKIQTIAPGALQEFSGAKPSEYIDQDFNTLKVGTQIRGQQSDFLPPPPPESGYSTPIPTPPPDYETGEYVTRR